MGFSIPVIDFHEIEETYSEAGVYGRNALLNDLRCYELEVLDELVKQHWGEPDTMDQSEEDSQ